MAGARQRAFTDWLAPGVEQNGAAAALILARNQKGHRRLAVFRLGALTGSLLTR
ncbi:MAG: hypothetical protein N3E45_00075 [Oscillatoriaceae bacterium SKW80]|nr:hypothetical protein [Oscillatoriaceae bacterium SKYG93]MCX8119226.1 hypothetical protein [Oscillatoriaceae bacterium SKW80]MDW8454693.1 hypothetical protein [Oscillatoriaceae cyanobacterium SKYGB_i_bin93]HIK28525.1 hypothetical protein [Oscillatoriaceae cyanobacterium M7585_C2015_266]